jgi:small subunit ribosomal protein S27Ae
VEEQRIIFNGKQLEDGDLLSVAGVESEATLNVLGRLLGGAKKRKKKTYTKPKKQKHKHKKIKLRVLKFYKVRACARLLGCASWVGMRAACMAAPET